MWCEAMHAIDEIDDRDLERLIEWALAHAKRPFRSLAGELDRRVRAWIIVNSTLGAGALATSGQLETVRLCVCHNRLWILRAGVCLHPRKCSSTGKLSGKSAGSNIEETLRDSSLPTSL